MSLHLLPWQYPQTPNVVPFQLANGIALIIGVESVLSSSRTNAAKNSTASGVAGLNIFATAIYARLW